MAKTKKRAEKVTGTNATVAAEHCQRGEWHGLEQFSCKHCQFDTLAGFAAMAVHLHRHHKIYIYEESEIKQVKQPAIDVEKQDGK